MTDEQFIAGFLKVFETKPEIFEQGGAVDALANLSNTISQMADSSNKEVADAIGNWCADYPKITDEINLTARKLKPEATKTEGVNERLSNRYPELPENLKKRLPKS
ncbi:MAG: hypothetical protein JGK24_18715 [Microcoleus sp. PH2017_29_MFU_D_A]|jgi:2-oxo-4-hydroxy-4-carboxy--5-ureidoimidazoline (OHCU) decarboxylase|uniref:hypothetical protein n=1 Tax=unclassified Microcoleus TaxID=2642155 RepID=UPI001D2FD0F3|nr:MULTISPECIES: hypothetical protein [unclassified Microcoleus]MCC3418822.1 hypothetical protein [Microcoleus sp. PH2017_07_MST_O_A]MCC3430127.1 hypothetical protein [Microcoleus sp. PH2017_04_SCI_O_A]MCC3441786.1 hypothetical protein [Microcoleus sp. PH2017_03_ELD_O_A]MCC3465626.1 hypothetical protein [Microcoleus sp. PH2017_06_SFM_O_A]MCC3502316.1 hypothetical protein [Microcoleus sp. PH2017_19_SFW_U_A]MCC3513889.1 hypothetical protein [Microcoleus sp. PH2017_17_BER_D_A]TAE16610.1 MAG: hy